MGRFPHQQVGTDWLRARPRALLADDPGCVDGKAIVRVNRAKRGFALSLAMLHSKFHETGGWDKKIPTHIRSLCDGVFRLNRVVDVIDRGMRPVLRIELASGKVLRVTGDHEICTGRARRVTDWRRADKLRAGTPVLTNGRPACALCGSSRQVVTDPYKKFRGHCRQCIYRKLRAKPTWIGGKHLDDDGYVLVSGQQDHPRARKGAVLEHILVMEQAVGRHLRRSEVVHHRNGVKTDNRLTNLELTTAKEHGEHHGKAGGYLHMNGGRAGRGGLICFIPKTDRVKSVRPDGSRHVYDVVCANPHRNFVANGIVVHNCGKTRQLLEALPEHPACLVICPAAVKGAWAAEVARWRPDLSSIVIEGRKGWLWPIRNTVVIANYEILPPGPNSAQFFREDWKADTGELVLIGDELHYTKSPDAQRTHSFRGLANAVRAAGGCTWGATGTPLLKDPMDLWNVCVALGLEWDAVNALPGNPEDGWWPRWLHAFNGEQKQIFIPGGKTRQIVEWGPPRACAHAAFAAVALRRTKAEVLPDLPPKLYQDVQVPLDAQTSAISDAALRALEAAGIDLETALAESTASKATVPALAEFAHACAALATAKWPTLIRLVRYYLEAGEIQVVFSAHRGPVEALVATVPSPDAPIRTITGDVSAAKRTEIVEEFQAGKIPILACTIQAAGIGLTLTRAALAIFADLTPTPALNLQAEDRLCRLGQTRGVRIIRLVADHALDRKILAICTRKAAHAAAVLQDPLGPRRGPTSAEDLTTLAILERAFAGQLIADPMAEAFASTAVASVGSGGALSERQWAQLHAIAAACVAEYDAKAKAGFTCRRGGA